MLSKGPHMKTYKAVYWLRLGEFGDIIEFDDESERNDYLCNHALTDERLINEEWSRGVLYKTGQGSSQSLILKGNYAKNISNEVRALQWSLLRP